MLIGTLDGTSVDQLSPGSEKRIRVKCDACGKVTTTIWHNYVVQQKRKGNTGRTMCRACACRITARSRIGSPAWNKGHMKPLADRSVKKYVLRKDGYMYEYAPTAQCMRGWGAYRKQHHLVIERATGKKVTKAIVVHHIDGDRTNNALSNLWQTTHMGHRDAHQSLQQLGYKLIRAGLIRFKAGNYLAHQKLLELLELPEAGNQQPSQSGMVGRSND